MTQGRGRWLTHEIVTTGPVTGQSRHLTVLSCYGPPVGGRAIAELTPMGLLFVFKSACGFAMVGYQGLEVVLCLKSSLSHVLENK